MRLIDLTGQTFTRLTVIAQAGYDKHRRARWLCRCTCGNLHEVSSNKLRTGTTQSCGCLNIELFKKRFTTHGKRKTPEYKIWEAMKRRCYVAKDKGFKNYGGRGISVCNRWLESFESFYNDIGKRPSNRHSLDRIDNNGNYEPSNCRWATTIEQAMNTRKNTLITYNGKTQCLSQWSRDTGIKIGTLGYRLRSGWSHEDVITKPVRGHTIRHSR